MVLIHGVLTPWQIWMPQIESFRNEYNIYAVALNAHTEEAQSQFVSVSSEVEEIIEYLKNDSVDSIDVLCGISLGGKIAFEIWKSGRLNVHNIIMDGAPLVSCPKFVMNSMIKNYKNIIHKSKARDKKIIENFKKKFLPEKYLDYYLKIADFCTDTSIENIVISAFEGGKINGVYNQCRILFIHGTRVNEMISKKSAKLIRQYYPDAQVVCFRGDAHCYKIVYEPEIWISVVKNFLNKQ